MSQEGMRTKLGSIRLDPSPDGKELRATFISDKIITLGLFLQFIEILHTEIKARIDFEQKRIDVKNNAH